MPPELTLEQSTTTNDNNTSTQPTDLASQVINDPAPVQPVQPAADITQLWQAVAQDNSRRASAAEQRAADLERRLQELENARSAPTPQDTERLREQYFADPVGTMRSVMRDDMQQIVAPLNTQLSGFSRQNEITRIVGLMQSQPQYKYLRIPEFSGWFNQQLQSVQNVTEATLAALYSSMVGYIAMNQPAMLGQMEALFNAPAPTPVVQNTPAPTITPPVQDRSQLVGNNPHVITPPHLRPSNPNPPAPTPQSSREYSENERKLMRERDLTPAQFDALMGAPATVGDWRTIVPKAK